MMADLDGRELSSSAKLVRVVLENCGPLSPTEVAAEAYLSADAARAGLAELEERGAAEPVCGVRAAREEIYALIDRPHRAEPST